MVSFELGKEIEKGARDQTKTSFSRKYCYPEEMYFLLD